MTRQPLLLWDAVKLHHKFKKPLSLGNTTRQLALSLNRPAQPGSCFTFSFAKAFEAQHTRKYNVLSSPSRTPIQFGTRRFSRFGKPNFPRKHSKLDFGTSKCLSTPKQSGTGSWITVLIVVFISGAVFFSTPPRVKNHLHEKSREFQEPTAFESSIAKQHIMAKESLPGRPGTLTPHEEEKLKEFWAATLQVFGLLDTKDINGDGHADDDRERRDSKLSDKKSKKKKLSLFRSKNKEGEDTSIESGAPAEEDKYGQTKEFHEALANLSAETLRATFWSMVKHDHPDGLLLRFLRARKWDVEKALVMMVSTMRWRGTEMKVDEDIMWNGEMAAFEDAKGSDPTRKKLGEDFLAQLRMGKSFLHGQDKDGRPMCFVRVRLHKQGEQSEASLERYTVFVIESARMILSPPVDTACVVFDMTNFSMANMDYAPVKFMIKCFEANYPESLGVVLVHKAPWIFQGIWKIIKGWLDPVVASKVHFTNDHEMEEYVPKSQIIKELHGSEDWEYQYIEPVPGENDKMKDFETRDRLLVERKMIVDEFEKATMEWINGGDAVTLKVKRNDLALKLRDDYWRLDPYIRARSYYDRVGLIQPGGQLQFYPGKKITPEPVATKVETVPTANGKTIPHQHSADDVD